MEVTVCKAIAGGDDDKRLGNEDFVWAACELQQERRRYGEPRAWKRLALLYPFDSSVEGEQRVDGRAGEGPPPLLSLLPLTFVGREVEGADAAPQIPKSTASTEEPEMAMREGAIERY